MSEQAFKQKLIEAVAKSLHNHTNCISTHIDGLKNDGYDLNDLVVTSYFTDGAYVTQLSIGDHKRTITQNTVVGVNSKRHN